MAKPATKTAKAPAKKAAAASTAKADTAATTSKSTSDEQAAGTATITFDKDKHGGKVRGAVNGQRFEFDVGKPVQVTEAQLAALSDSGATFTVNQPLKGVDADEGSSASTTVAGTATRLAAPDEGGAQVDKDGNPLPTPELRQITDKELTDGADQQASQEQAKDKADEKAEDK